MFRQSRTHAFIRLTVTSAAIATDVQTRTFLLICARGSLQTYQLQELLLISSIQKTSIIENEFQLRTEIRIFSVSITRFISVASSAACRKLTDPIMFSSWALGSSIFGEKRHRRVRFLIYQKPFGNYAHSFRQKTQSQIESSTALHSITQLEHAVFDETTIFR